MEIWLIRHGDTLKATQEHYDNIKKAPIMLHAQHKKYLFFIEYI